MQSPDRRCREVTLRLRCADAAPECRTVARTCRAVIGRGSAGLRGRPECNPERVGRKVWRIHIREDGWHTCRAGEFRLQYLAQTNARVANITALPCLQYPTHKDGVGRTS